MILTPVVDRELRVASRRGATYSSRAAGVLFAILIGIWIQITLAGWVPQAVAGAQLFRALTWLAIVYAVIAGTRATADCISSEKRQGTLGLLFLTDLKRHDVILGKSTASSIDALYGIGAMLPVLAIPMMMGGVTAGEFCRMAFLIPVILLLAISCAIYCSSISFVERKAVEAAIGLLFLIVAGVPGAAAGLAQAWDRSDLIPAIMMASPLRVWWAALDENYQASPVEYWLPLSLTVALVFLLFAAAARATARTWADRPIQTRRLTWQVRLREWARGSTEVRKRFRSAVLRVNPILWLISRERYVRSYPWIFIASTLLFWTWGIFNAGGVHLDGTVATFCVVHAIFKYWLATLNCYGFNTDRDTGTLEVILSTPLRLEEILHGQWLALRRMFGQPFLALVILEPLLMTWAVFDQFARSGDRVQWILIGAFGLVLLFADCIALGWLGIWLGVRAKTPHRGTMQAVSAVLILPWALIACIASGLAIKGSNPNEKLWPILWLTVSLLVDLVIALWARKRILSSFRKVAAERYGSKARAD